jgi:hypothetical protein
MCPLSLLSNDKGIFTEPLPSNDRGDTDTHTYTHRQQRDLINYKLNSAVLVRERTIPTERPPLVGELT